MGAETPTAFLAFPAGPQPTQTALLLQDLQGDCSVPFLHDPLSKGSVSSLLLHVLDGQSQREMEPRTSDP